MNERIKTLIKESGGHNIAYEGRPGSYSYAFTDNSVEKFAELILKDIDKIVDDLYHSLPLEQAAVLLVLDENIKEHFYGIEE